MKMEAMGVKERARERESERERVVGKPGPSETVAPIKKPTVH